MNQQPNIPDPLVSLWRLTRSDDEVVRAKASHDLIMALAPAVEATVKTIAVREWEDEYQSAMCDDVPEFILRYTQMGRGSSLMGFVLYWVKKRVKKRLSERSRLPEIQPRFTVDGSDDERPCGDSSEDDRLCVQSDARIIIGKALVDDVDRALAMARFFDDMTIPEIASRFGMTRPNVCDRIEAIRHQLAQRQDLLFLLGVGSGAIPLPASEVSAPSPSASSRKPSGL